MAIWPVERQTRGPQVKWSGYGPTVQSWRYACCICAILNCWNICQHCIPFPCLYFIKSKVLRRTCGMSYRCLYTCYKTFLETANVLKHVHYYPFDTQNMSMLKSMQYSGLAFLTLLRAILRVHKPFTNVTLKLNMQWIYFKNSKFITFMCV